MEAITVTITGPDHLDKGTLTSYINDAISFKLLESDQISRNLKGTSTQTMIDGKKIAVHFNIQNDLDMPEVEG